MTFFLFTVILVTLAFDYINGFHDTANAIATVVSTRVMTPTNAILMAATLNIAGALMSTHVASTISKGIVQSNSASTTLVLAAVIGAIAWNLITWYYGIPSSSSHALIGGLVGAAVASGGFSAVIWSSLLDKVIYPLVASPLAGFAAGYLLMLLIAKLVAHLNAARAGNAFRRLQLVSAAAMALSHGQNDAQKSMGIITLALFTSKLIPVAEVPLWVKLACAMAMGLGTSAGGWRVIKTLGHKIIRLQPVDGFAAETAGAAVIFTASHYGMPISTTHAISSSIFGVGASKRLSAVRWKVAHHMVLAWIITIPASAAVGALSFFALHLVIR